MNNKKVGENALERVTRLLTKFTNTHKEEGTNQFARVILDPDGSGYIAWVSENEAFDDKIFDFITLDQLEQFLMAPTIRQMLGARYSREN